MTITFIIILMSPICFFGQEYNKNAITLDYGVARITTGDFWGFHIQNAYKITLSDYFSIRPRVSVVNASSKSVIARDDPNATYKSYDHPGPVFSNGQWGETLNSGAIKLTPHLDRSLFVTAGIDFAAGLYGPKHSGQISMGPSFAYVDQSFFAWTTTTAPIDLSIHGVHDVKLAVPLYHRMLAFGFNIELDYQYKVRSDLGIGVGLAFNQYITHGHNLAASLSLSYMLDKE